jgi:tetratricopeptide (TPR) repeat protein
MGSLRTQIGFLLGLGFTGGAALAQEEGAPPALQLEANPTETTSPEERLSEAIQAYQRGDRETALAVLSELANDPAIQGTDARLQALIYLGEVHFVQGNEQWARQFFEQVIKTDPRYVLDPFRHPPDVASFFHQVKLTMDLSGLEPEPIPIRPPRNAWSPLAIYHFKQGRTGRAWLYGGTQVIAGTSSIILASILLGKHDWSIGGIPYEEGDSEALASIQRLQQANLVSFLGFYGAWGLSVVDAQRHWQARRLEASQSALPAQQLQLSFNIQW